MSNTIYTDAHVNDLLLHSPHAIGSNDRKFLMDAFYSTFDWEFIVTIDLLLYCAVKTVACCKIDPVGPLPEIDCLSSNFSVDDISFINAVRDFLRGNRYPGDRIVSALLKNLACEKYDQISIPKALRDKAFDHDKKLDRMESAHQPFHETPEGYTPRTPAAQPEHRHIIIGKTLRILVKAQAALGDDESILYLNKQRLI